MKRQPDHSRKERHAVVKQKYDDVQSDGRYEEGMARMALYHHHCQDPVIFRALGDVRGKSLLDLACGDGFYTRRFRTECGADPVMGIDLSSKQIERAEAIEQQEPLGIDYRVGDVMELRLDRRFDVATAIHLLHYLENAGEIASTLSRIYDLLDDRGYFVTMIALTQSSTSTGTTHRIRRRSLATTSHWPSPAMVAYCAFTPGDLRKSES